MELEQIEMASLIPQHPSAAAVHDGGQDPEL